MQNSDLSICLRIRTNFRPLWTRVILIICNFCCVWLGIYCQGFLLLVWFPPSPLPLLKMTYHVSTQEREGERKASSRLACVAEMLSHGLKQWLSTWWEGRATQGSSGACNASQTSFKGWQWSWGDLSGDSWGLQKVGSFFLSLFLQPWLLHLGLFSFAVAEDCATLLLSLYFPSYYSTTAWKKASVLLFASRAIIAFRLLMYINIRNSIGMKHHAELLLCGKTSTKNYCQGNSADIFNLGHPYET